MTTTTLDPDRAEPISTMISAKPPIPPPAVLPPVTLLLDRDDDHAVLKAAYRRSDPARGRITADPTPYTSSPAYLALDLLRALDRGGFSRPGAERMSTDPSWRAVTCWTLATGLREAIVLRAHLLTSERLGRLAAWRAATGIRLVLIAHTPRHTDEQRLRKRLTDAGLTNLRTLRGTEALLEAIGPAATGRRFGPPPPDHAYRLPMLPRSGIATFRADCWRRQNTTDFAHTDGQYRAGYAATRTWLARYLPSNAEWPPGGPEHSTAEPAAWNIREIEALRLFLARLTTLSPSPQHTLARVRGAQAGFLSRAVLLDVPDDLAAHGGPGITTVPFTAPVEYAISTRLPNPLRAAALAALLFTGTATALLSMSQLESVHDQGAVLAVDRDSRMIIGATPRPRHMYAVPPRARPLIRAALDFRRRTPRTAEHHSLFANCFGTSERFDNLIADAGLPIPALVHPHPGQDWHATARCWHLNSPAPDSPPVLPRPPGVRS